MSCGQSSVHDTRWHGKVHMPTQEDSALAELVLPVGQVNALFGQQHAAAASNAQHPHVDVQLLFQLL